MFKTSSKYFNNEKGRAASVIYIIWANMVNIILGGTVAGTIQT
jgi:hypothetical protein